MTQVKFIPFIVLLLMQAQLYAAEEISLKCRSGDRDRFLSVAVLKRGSEVVYNGQHERKGMICSPPASEGAYDLREIARVGLPMLYPAGLVKVGDVVRERFTFRHEEGEIPAVISYRIEKIDKMLSRDVAVIGLLLNASGNRGGADPEAGWRGVGHEVWDLGGGAPFLRVLEIRHGKSFEAGYDLELSYAESKLF